MRLHLFRLFLMLVLLPLTQQPATAQEVNYDESQVPAYTLPDPLKLSDGTSITTPSQWSQRRRPEILELFREHVYGHAPDILPETTFEVTEQSANTLDGVATRKQVAVRFTTERAEAQMSMLVYLPGDRSTPAPLIVGLNFGGNHTVVDDPNVYLPAGADEEMRGAGQDRWPIRDMLARGYGFATVYYEDIVPDEDDPFDEGVFPLFYEPGQTRPAPNEWGAIGAWAWGMSRMLDYAESDAAIDAERVMAVGHSRLGKATLWAGARDERFAIVVSNESGCGGAALSRRRFGETVKRINDAFPHWFSDRFTRYNDREEALPVDQHLLIALIAPRPVYVASAERDRWADPRGEFLAAREADPVYALFGKEGLPVDTMPPVNRPVHGTIGYHIRSGEHDLTSYDWQQYLDVADRHFRNNSH